MTAIIDAFPIPAPTFNGNSRSVPAGNAFEWLSQGWALFVANPGSWVALAVIFIALMFGLTLVPLIGGLAATLLAPVLGAGLLRASQSAANGKTSEIADLFAGFKQNTNALLLLGVYCLLALLFLLVLVFVLGGGSVASMIGAVVAGSPAGVGLALGGLLLTLLLSTVLMVPVLMALWFAPALVLFNHMAPVDALKASFNACLKNVPAFLVYGLVVLVLLFFAALPAGLGLLVLLPVIAGSSYVSYRDIFLAN